VHKIIKIDREPGIVLEYSGEKILDNTQAWQVTNTKWETIREACLCGYLITDGGVNTCGLCALYFYGHSEECELCPITEVGYPGCSNTPYEEYQPAVKSGDLAAALRAAEREIEFLTKVNQ
jgi:hypothetical protein